MIKAHSIKTSIWDLRGMKPGDTITVGRGKECDIVLDHASVSSLHVRLLAREDGVFVRDLESREGTRLNGKNVAGLERLRNGDILSIAELSFSAKLPQSSHVGAKLMLDNVSVSVNGKKILKDVSLSIEPGEFVGIVGPSGCGKSTMMGVAAGVRNASSGRVLINNDELSGSALREKVGFLPQFVIAMEKLAPEEALNYARNLFDGDKLSTGEALANAGLEDRKKQIIGELSGGQQKRAGLALELLFQPDLLCLDEVTSGLDPSSEKEMMVLFRQISDKGRTVLCITHYPERLALCDRLAVLMDGKIIFFGTPQETLRHFNISSLGDLYEKMSERKAGEWIKKFKAPLIDVKKNNAPPPEESVDFFKGAKQLPVLVARYVRVWARSPSELAFLVIQGVVIGLLIGLCFGSPKSGINAMEEAGRCKPLLFSLILAAIWIGATTSVREIVKERKIIAHEGRRKLSAMACVLSRFAVLSFFSCVGVLLLCLAVMPWTAIPGNAPALVLTLLLTASAASALGLVVSALCPSQEKALTVLPVVIIGLVLFSGGIQTLEKASLFAGRTCCFSYWAFDLAKRSLPRRVLDARTPVFESPALPVSGIKTALKKPKGALIIEKPESAPLALLAVILHGFIFLLAAAYGVRRLIKGKSLLS